jgi:hypothetical protein
MAGEGVRCPVCGSGLTYEKPYHAVRPIEYYPCPKCGEYLITIQAKASLPGLLRKPAAAALLSYFIRRLPRTGDEDPNDLPVIKTEFLEAVLEHERLPDPPEQVENMILWLGANTSSGKYRQITKEIHQSLIGCAEPDGVWWVRDYLVEENLVKSKNTTEQRPGGGSVSGDGYTLSYRGWERYRELREKAVRSKIAFMAMDFQHAAELDAMFYEHFKPAVAQTGFDLRRIDENPLAGSIDNRLRLEIRRARFAVVDLTYDNSGAYWEAGFAEGLGRTVFYTCRKDEKVHFDARQSLIIFWEPDKLADAAKRLKEAIRVTIPEAKQED